MKSCSIVPFQRALRVPLNLRQVRQVQVRQALKVRSNPRKAIQARLPAGRALRALRSPTTKTSSQAINHHKVIAPPQTPRQMFPQLTVLPPPTPTNPRVNPRAVLRTPTHLAVALQVKPPNPPQASPTPPRPPQASPQALAVAPAETPQPPSHLPGTPTPPATHPENTRIAT